MSRTEHRLEQVRERLSSGQGKLLVIQTAFLGDVVLITPLLRSAKRAFPRARITVLCLPECAGVLRGQVDDIITFDKRDGRNLQRHWRELILRLRGERFDVALIPHRSMRSGLTALKAGIGCRIGFNRGAGAPFHTDRVVYQPRLYEGRRNLRLLTALTGMEDPSDKGLPELAPSDEDIRLVSDILTGLGLRKGGFVVVAPGSVWATKRWPAEYYRQLADKLDGEFNLPSLAIGGAEDVEVCSRVVRDSSFNKAGELSPLQAAALMSRARLVVSGDTAPAHIATAVGAAQVIIFGSTSPRFGFAPPTPQARIAGIDLWCRPCTGHGRRHCPRWGSLKCMRRVTADMVMEIARDRL